MPRGGVMEALKDRAAANWFLLLASIFFAWPLLERLGRDVWTLNQSAQGPIIFATGAWLLVREMGKLSPAASNIALAALGAAAFVFLSTLGSLLGLLWLELIGAFGALVAIVFAYYGHSVRKLWFPVLYLLALIPPPYALIAPFTHQRKLWLSKTATDVLSWFGYDVARSGNDLFIDQYELHIANACAGMNSLISLLAVGLFYVYLRHSSSWRYALVLGVLVFPLAMVANLVRVIFAILAVHYGGSSYAEGTFHDVLGLLMFILTFLLLVGADAALESVRRWLDHPKRAPALS